MNVMLVCGATGTSADRTETAIESFGHVATQVDHDEFRLGVVPYSGYDVIVLHRINRTSGNGDMARQAIETGGKPILNMADANPDGTQTPVMNYMGLSTGSSQVSVTNGGSAFVVTDDSHSITAGLTEGAQTALFAGNTKAQGLNSGFAGTSYATCDPDIAALSGKANLVIVPAGTTFVSGSANPTLCDYVFWGWAPESNDFNSTGLQTLGRILDLLQASIVVRASGPMMHHMQMLGGLL